MKIIISNDHAGTNLKIGIIEYLNKNNHEVINLGANNLDSVDYPDFAYNVAKRFTKDVIDFGILICGSGIGISIAANRFSHIRAALCNDIETTKLARLHNDANILVLSGRSTDKDLAIDCIRTFFNTNFEGGRHINRINKLSNPPKI